MPDSIGPSAITDPGSISDPAMASYLKVLLAALPLTQGVLAGTPPTAKVKNGTYEGKYVASYDQDLFLGIPYAQAPVGDLRFQNPQSLNTTFRKRSAVEYADSCVGYGVSRCHKRLERVQACT